MRFCIGTSLFLLLLLSSANSFTGVRMAHRRLPPSCYTGTPSIGDVCPGGAIYAGTFGGSDYMVPPGGCGYEPSGSSTSAALTDFTPTCTGVDVMTKFWNDGGANPYFDIPGVENIAGNANPSTVLGEVNSAAIVSITAAGEGGYHAAARYCDKMVFGGYDDWFLPSKSEMAYIYCKSRISGSASYPNEDPDCASNGYGTGTHTLANFSTSAPYHTSNEYSTGGGFSYKIAFSTGLQSNSAKNLALLVRCLRRVSPIFQASQLSPESYSGSLSLTGLNADYLAVPQSQSQTFLIRNIGDKPTTGLTINMPTYFEQVGGTCSSMTVLNKNESCTMSIRAKVSAIVFNDPIAGTLTIADSGKSIGIFLSGTVVNFPDPCDSPSVTIGTLCEGGTYYAGAFDSGKYMVTPGNCGYEPSGSTTSYSATNFTPTCTGAADSMTKTWRGVANNYDIPGAENVTAVATKSSSSYRGDVNTAAIVAITNSSEGGYHPAARYCDMLDFGGYQDWYLPSKSELAFLYCKAKTSGGVSNPQEDPNCSTYGYGSGSEVIPGFRTTANYYWSSTETSSSTANTIKASDGTQVTAGSKNTAYYVRCVRRF